GVNLNEWAATPIWKDPEACVGNLRPSITGTLGNPGISEAGRQFLADLLGQLTDSQLHDLFDVAGVGRHAASSRSAQHSSGEDWVAAFKHKRDEIASHHCPQ